ncbi:hypothetical protein JTB14_021157 [Gonioctena quinquepunctata]|nr:hypothetical protein JTB14_021157 [Gonioctena quinquepunctata]
MEIQTQQKCDELINLIHPIGELDGPSSLDSGAFTEVKCNKYINLANNENKSEGKESMRLVDRFRSGLPGVTILAYLHDLIILSETFEKHLQDLDMVFQRLEMYKLRLNRAKCIFVCPVVKYLGHLITPHGIKSDPNKVRAILEREPPTDVKQVMSFI